MTDQIAAYYLLGQAGCIKFESVVAIVARDQSHLDRTAGSSQLQRVFCHARRSLRLRRFYSYFALWLVRQDDEPAAAVSAFTAQDHLPEIIPQRSKVIG